MPNRRCWYELVGVLVLAVITTAVFWLTDSDLRLAAWFYRPENLTDVWPLQHLWLLKLLFDYAFPFTVFAGSLALLVYLISHIHDGSRQFRRQALYILLVIALGPGVVVNLIVKDHWGRPRPVHVQQFGGQFQYVPPAKIGGTTDKSFVCGHCSVGYAFFVVYFLAQNHKLIFFLITITLAWIMGFTRMTAGGHFVSDILWSGYLVFLVAWALYYGWYDRTKAFWYRETT